MTVQSGINVRCSCDWGEMALSAAMTGGDLC